MWRIMANTLMNTITHTYVVTFLSASIFRRGYHSSYQNFEFTAYKQVGNLSEHAQNHCGLCGLIELEGNGEGNLLLQSEIF